MGSDIIIPVVLLVLLMIFGIFFLVNINKQNKKGASKSSSTSTSEKKSTTSNQTKDSDIPKKDVFSFMEFDRILDGMIVQNNGQKYTMIVKCKGINYDLMSEAEQLAIEEGFITFLNTLRFPIQLYVQAQNVDLKKTISKYNENLKGIASEFEQANQEYNQAINSLDSTKEEIRNAEYNKKSVQNVLEYATDIVKYVERLSTNKSLLKRSFYVVLSYYTSEITSLSNFSKDEIVNICYNELYTRCASIISALSSCSVSGTVLNSNQLAELLYTSYNRDDSKYIDIERALESGYYRLYSTSDDAFTKREALLKEQIDNEAQLKAYEAIKKAIEDGEYQTPEMQQISINEEISKNAIDIVRNEDIDDNIKEKAKDIIVEDYKKTKQEIIKKASKKSDKKESEPKEEKVEEKVAEPVAEEKKVTEEPIKEPIVEPIIDKKDDVVETDNVIVDTKDTKNTEEDITQSIAEESLVEPQEAKKEDKKEEKVVEPVEEEKKVEEQVEPEQENDKKEDNNTSSSDDFDDDFFDSII